MDAPLTPHGAKLAAPPLRLENAQLVLHDRVILGYLSIDGGAITEVAAGSELPEGAIDCGGDFVLADLVELHTANLEHHIEPRPEVDWPPLLALIAHDAKLASVGITTEFDAMRVGPMHGSKGRSKRYARMLAGALLAANRCRYL